MRSRLSDIIFRPVDGSGLALFRIVFGAIMMLDMRYFYEYRTSLFPAEAFQPTWDHLEFTRTWWRDVDVLLPALAIAAGCICVGLFTRICAAVFWVGFTWLFLGDPTQFNNHFYLISLFAFWFIFIKSNCCWSIDSWLMSAVRSRVVPGWHFYIFRFQLFVVYFYGGIAKLNYDWLRGEPMRIWAKVEADMPVLGGLLGSPYAGYVFAWGGLVFDLLIPFVLLNRRTRILGLIAATLFHLTNVFVFHIGVFPWLMIGTSVLWMEPDWPRRVVAKLFGGETKKDKPAEPESETTHKPIVFGLLMAYIVVQLLVPFRHWLYEGNVEWNQEGKPFAWRMMLSHKYSFALILVIDRSDGKFWFVEQDKHLAATKQQQPRGVLGTPRRLAQYARWLRQEALDGRAVVNGREVAMTEPDVRVFAVMSLNGRPYQYVVKPDIDLAAADVPFFGTAKWITPLKPNQPIGEYVMDKVERLKRMETVLGADFQAMLQGLQKAQL